MRDRNLVGEPVVAATKKKKKKKRHLESGRYKRSPSWFWIKVRAGVLLRRNDNRRLDVDQKEEEEEEAEEGSRNFEVDSETTNLEEKEEKTRRRRCIGNIVIQRIHCRQDRPITSWTGRPCEFSL